MISGLLALAASLVALQADPINDARRAYNDCLRSHMRAQLEERVEPAAFEASLQGRCADRETAYTAALVARDTRAGGNRARAEEDARMTMEDMRATTVEYYSDYHSNNSKPD
jgi:hypothetical protein